MKKEPPSIGLKYPTKRPFETSKQTRIHYFIPQTTLLAATERHDKTRKHFARTVRPYIVLCPNNHNLNAQVKLPFQQTWPGERTLCRQRAMWRPPETHRMVLAISDAYFRTLPCDRLPPLISAIFRRSMLSARIIMTESPLHRFMKHNRHQNKVKKGNQQRLWEFVNVVMRHEYVISPN